MKILIVDDSKMMCLKIKGIFESIHKDAEFFVFQSAEEAQASIDSNAFDIASLDLNLPGKDGLYIAEQIRQKSKDTIIVIITANRQDAVAERAKLLNCNLLHKPADKAEVEKFLETLHSLIRQC